MNNAEIRHRMINTLHTCHKGSVVPHNHEPTAVNILPMAVATNQPPIIKLADYIIDMGPEGGRGGGQLLSTGTPEEVAKSSKGYTPRFIKEELKN